MRGLGPGMEDRQQNKAVVMDRVRCQPAMDCWCARGSEQSNQAYQAGNHRIRRHAGLAAYYPCHPYRKGAMEFSRRLNKVAAKGTRTAVFGLK